MLLLPWREFSYNQKSVFKSLSKGLANVAAAFERYVQKNVQDNIRTERRSFRIVRIS